MPSFLPTVRSLLRTYRIGLLVPVLGAMYLAGAPEWTYVVVLVCAALLEAALGERLSFADDAPGPLPPTGLSPDTLRAALDHLPGIFFVLDQERRIRHWNRDFTEISGYTAQELYGRPALDIVAEEDQDAIQNAIDRVLSEGSAQVEAQFVTDDGRHVPVLFSGTSVQIDGETYVVGTGTNILRRLTAEMALREAEREYRLLAESISDVVTRHRPDGTRDYVSPSVEDLMGVPAYDLIGTSLLDYIHADDKAKVFEAFNDARAHEAGTRIEYRLQHGDGHYLWVESNGRFTQLPDGTKQFVSVTRDISLQKANEAALRSSREALEESQLLLEKTEEVATVGGWTYDPVREAATWTQQVRRILEVPEDFAFTTEQLPQFFPDGEWDRVRALNRRAIVRGESYETDVQARTGRGRRIWLRISCDTDAMATTRHRIWGTVQDISDRREMENELRVTARRLEALISSLHEGVLVETEDRRLHLTNQRFCDLFDIDAEPGDLVGMDCAHAARASASLLVDADAFLADIESCLQAQEPVIGERMEMTNGRVLERDYLPIEVDGEYWGHLWKYRDVTAREKRERELRAAKTEAEEARHEAERAERLKSLFLANMSHEIRTPLTSIIGFSEVLEEEVPQPYDRMARLVGRSGRRLLDTISSVLDLSKLEAGRWFVDRESMDVREPVRDASELYAPRASAEGLDFEVTLPDARVPAFLDRSAVDRILDNLVGNALKFTPDGGRIGLHLTTSEDGMALIVEDDGPGIPTSMRDHLFEPFVHSPQEMRDDAQGSGLGLAITKRLVEEMEGTIDVETSRDQGTRFTIWFPHPEDLPPSAEFQPSAIDMSS